MQVYDTTKVWVADNVFPCMVVLHMHTIMNYREPLQIGQRSALYEYVPDSARPNERERPRVNIQK